MNLVAESICRACGAESATLLHRFVLCSARKEQRDEQCAKWLLHQASVDSSDPLFQVGVPPRPICPPPPKAVERWIGQILADGALARGRAYTDGAMRGTYSRAKRAGWDFVVADEGNPMWGKYG